MEKVLRRYLYSGFVLFSLVIMVGCHDRDSINVNDGLKIKERDLSAFFEEEPERKLNLLFIHHSCGATLLAEPGEKKGEYCLYSSHPNGGGLRHLLEQNNYNVHEATYGSKIGQDTDICHWNAKFRDDMDIILKTNHQDRLYSDGSVNNIIMFKSCYPTSEIIAEGNPPGDPDSCEKTIANYKATFNNLRSYFEQYPEALFVVVSAPPVVKPSMNPAKEFLDDLSGNRLEAMANRARNFNNWLKDLHTGWLKDYELRNVVVFDFYDILTQKGKSNWAEFPSRNGQNSHPSSEGNSIAARKFIRFINQTVRFAGLV